MSDQANFNFEEAMHGVAETRTALGRAQAGVDRLERLLTERPAAFEAVAAAAFHLRDRLVEDLGTLEAQLAQAESAVVADAQPHAPGQRARLAEGLGVSQGDMRALGGQ
jgi:hypothetical protein